MSQDREAFEESLRKAGVLAEIKKAQAEPQALLVKGDVPGHEFHGNQWTGGEGDVKGAIEHGAGKQFNPASSRSASGHTSHLMRVDAKDKADQKAKAAQIEANLRQAGLDRKFEGHTKNETLYSNADRSHIVSVISNSKKIGSGTYHSLLVNHVSRDAAKLVSSDLSKIHNPHKVHNKTLGKWRVVDDDGHQYGSHGTEAEADAQLAALYANKDKE